MTKTVITSLNENCIAYRDVFIQGCIYVPVAYFIVKFACSTYIEDNNRNK